MKAICFLPFFVGYISSFFQTFENFNLNWYGDSADYIISANNIQLSANEPGESEIHLDHLNYFSYSYEYYLSLNFNPSSSNKFEHVIYNSENEKLLLRLGESGSEDRWRLIKSNGGNEDLLLSSQLIYSQSFDSLCIKVQKSYDRLEVILDLDTLITDFVPSEELLSLSFKSYYTSSNIDGVLIEGFKGGETSKDTIAPKLISLRFLSKDSLELGFNEPVIISSELNSFSRAKLFKTDDLSIDNKLITINIEIFDRNENKLFLDTIINTPFVEFQELAFTELMIDPSPSLGYYNEDFIEIMNLSERCYRDLDLFLVNNGDTLLISIDTLCPDSLYVINDVYLNNESFKIELLDQYHDLIDAFVYEEGLFTKKPNSSGGWSLEKEDADYFGDYYESWSYHESFKGASPGTHEDLRILVDNERPYVETVEIENDTVYSFNEPIYQNGNVGTRSTTIDGIKDLSGNALSDTLISFQDFDFVSNGDIQISEVFFNGSGEIPEYIEFESHNNKPVLLQNSRLVEIKDGETIPIYSFPSRLIQANEIFVITKDKYVLKELNSALKNKIVLDLYFPDLKSSEMSLAIIRDNGEVIDEVYYDKDWFNSLSLPKYYSIERINRDGKLESSWQPSPWEFEYFTPGYTVFEHSETTNLNIKLREATIDQYLELEMESVFSGSISAYLFTIQGDLIEVLTETKWMGSSNKLVFTRSKYAYSGPAIINLLLEKDGQVNRVNLNCYLL